MNETISVPCNGCKLCCRHDAIFVSESLGDDVTSYVTEAIPNRSGERMLAHKPNGDCVYLGPKGCTIHNRAPYLCRTFDCRIVWLADSGQRHDKIARGLMNKQVYLRGRDLLKRYPQPEHIRRWKQARRELTT